MDVLVGAGAPLWVVIVGVLLVAVGGGVGVTQLYTAKSTARKLQAESEKLQSESEKVDAEAVQSIVSAATALVGPLEKRIASTEGDLREQRAAIETLRSDLHTRDQLAAEHSGWDHFVELKAQEHGIALPPRPPLRPGPV